MAAPKPFIRYISFDIRNDIVSCFDQYCPNPTMYEAVITEGQPADDEIIVRYCGNLECAKWAKLKAQAIYEQRLLLKTGRTPTR